MKIYSLLSLFCSLFFALTLDVNAQLLLKEKSPDVQIGKHVYILNDTTERAFQDVVKSENFIRNETDVPNLGISKTSAWLRFTVKSTSELNNLYLMVAYPILDEVELYAPSKQTYKSISLGEVKPFYERLYKQPNYIFKLDIPKGQANTFFLRVKSSEQLILPINIVSEEKLWEYLTRENLITGIYFGIVLIMVLYNLFIYFSVRDKSYLYYVIYVAFVGLTQVGIKGYLYQYLWPTETSFQLKSVILFGCISGIAGLLFTKNFLATKKNAKVAHVIFNIIIVLFIVAFIVTSFGPIDIGFILMQNATSLFALSILVTSFVIMRRGYEPAKFFFFAWSVLLIGAIIFLLKDYNILPYNTITSYSMQAASAIEMAILSFALANRINILKKEKEASQAELLLAAQENARIVREQNVILETKVDERTQELSLANSELNQTLIDLKEAEGQLVEAEKMASLGQLTAGIAHEINNPINFVTSNVNPLRRDVEMLFQAIEEIESVGLSSTEIEAKKQKIDEYKDEIDYDYLKTEIGHLLNGIQDGASRTAEIVKGLRIFSRLDEDDLKKADINEGIDSTLIIVNNLLNGKIKIEKRYEKIPLIDCYPGKLNQVFLNILSNAIYAVSKKFANTDGGKIEIETKNRENGITVIIRDNGIGMDDVTKKKIFEPFFTTKDVGEGTGLGMSIAYNTIRRHEGEICVNSTPGEGTEFILDLPLVLKPIELPQ